ncbi:PEP-CTERM sorting domain-containing protein [Crateriforma conspicua]|uniref:Ice-binding protein C-terminal domain-containing protein n=1 Tax=Crateriforma conspicua TaxID=2527996 RepID=A0A5C5Y2X7_9PLAN|nr:PEP-CTERM sorting domain-containing protein [Crateriforma conspicua]QDV63769.1 hypothetical protein Mal65_29150 [Crateriforma conspicua]TWT69149.1 hypothetical protein Pan14r_14330 [Crateriforma conspicua]
MRVQPAGYVAVLVILVSGTSAVEGGIVTWMGSSGVTPNAVGYSLFDNSTPEDPVFTTPTLTLQSDNVLEQMFYSMSGTQLNIPSQTVVDFEMAYISGFSNQVFREVGLVAVTVAPDVSAVLFVGNDEVFFLDGPLSRGPENTSVDTNAFHDYSLVVDGKTLGSPIRLFQDGNLILAGTTYSSGATTETILFGDGTTNAQGETQWRSFTHNASAVPEPASSLMFLFGVGAVSLQNAVQRRRRLAGASSSLLSSPRDRRKTNR